MRGNGRDDWTWTSDLCVPNAALYQAELRPANGAFKKVRIHSHCLRQGKFPLGNSFKFHLSMHLEITSWKPTSNGSQSHQGKQNATLHWNLPSSTLGRQIKWVGNWKFLPLNHSRKTVILFFILKCFSCYYEFWWRIRKYVTLFRLVWRE